MNYGLFFLSLKKLGREIKNSGKERRDRDSNPGNSYPFTAFRVRPDRPLRHLSKKIKAPFENSKSALQGGETGIRTPGTSRYNGFQDRRNRPLCHLSKTSFEVLYLSKAMQRYRFFLNMQSFWVFFSKKKFFFFISVCIIQDVSL